MTFQYLESGLVKGKESDLRDYLEVSLGLEEPTRTVLGYTLDIASYLQTLGLQDEYSLFGGYAILSNLMEQFGERVCLEWRGSNDIDMAGTQRVLNAFKEGYDFKSDRPSPNISHKRTLKLTEDNESECKIDYYLLSPQETSYIPEMHSHFGIPVYSANPLSLINGKLNTPNSEFVHSLDIINMLAVLEKRGESPEVIARYFIGKRKEKLLGKIKGDKIPRFGYVPSPKFKKELESLLK
jgi:hypothetical protein